jgi:Matrixin
MSPRNHVVARSLVCLAVLLAPAGAARAYCRTTTVIVRSSVCPEPCDSTGEPLHWLSPDITYTLNERGFPGLSDTDVRSALAASFDAWAAVRCEGQPIDFRFTEDPGTTDELAVHHDAGANVNAIALLTAEEWADAPHSPVALALTSVHFGTFTGTIFGADIEFNGGLARFGLCPAEGCAEGDPTVDLQNSATHEIGHLLGFSHVRDPLATMSCSAGEGDVDKRTLGSDDVAGLCAAYPPGEAFAADAGSDPTDDAVAHKRGGCSALPGRASEGLAPALAVLMGLLAVLLRRARARRPARGGARVEHANVFPAE